MNTFLTSNYLSLMNAFKHHSDARVDKLPSIYPKHSTSLLAEYCTLRLDGGRQSGKSVATTHFAADWLMDGGTVIVLSDKSSYARITADRIKKRMKEFGYSDNHLLISNSVRSYVGNEAHFLRGRSLTRILYIIDEPMKVDMGKIYEVHQKTVWPSMLGQGVDKQSLFFVIGMQ
ncbi:hypothetical protein [Yersinia phage MHG19]|nr:hypothetical protein [Yersinia phage MHG19]